MHEHRAGYSVAAMSRAFNLSPGGVYAFCHSPARATAREGRIILSHLRFLRSRTRQAYGSRRIRTAVKTSCSAWGGRRIARVMRQNEPFARARKGFQRTSDLNRAFSIATKLLQRSVRPEAPDRAWASDVTHVSTREGRLYFAATLDLFSRRVVGWSVGTASDSGLVLCVLEMAHSARKPAPWLVHHRDRGSTYASNAFPASWSGTGL